MTKLTKVIEALVESDLEISEDISVHESAIKELKEKRRGIKRTLKSFGYDPDATIAAEKQLSKPAETDTPVTGGESE